MSKSNEVQRTTVIEKNGALGWIGQDKDEKPKFVKLTNWAPKIVAKVTDNHGTVVSCVYEHPRDDRVGDKEVCKSYRTVLTMDEISKQSVISKKLSKKAALFTQDYGPKKEPYLPDIFFSLVQNIQDDVPEIVPITELGLQYSNDTSSVWVMQSDSSDSNSSVRLFQEKNGFVDEVDSEEVGLVSVNSEFVSNQLISTTLPFTVNNSSTVVHNLKAFLDVYYDINLPPLMVVLGATVMAQHYSILADMFSNIAIPVIVGKPGCGKTAAVELVFSILGISESIHDPTYAGVLDELTASASPVWWEDVEDKTQEFEKVSFMIYNKSIRKKANSKKTRAKTLPVCTTNGYFLKKKSGDELRRYMERLVLIPFQYDSESQSGTYIETMSFKSDNTKMKAQMVLLLPVLLSCVRDIKNMFADDFAIKINDLLEDVLLKQTRDLSNYGKLLHVTAMILSKLNYSEDEIMDILNEFLVSYLMPYLEKIHKEESAVDRVESNYGNLLEKVIVMAMAHPEAKEFIRKSTPRCNCGEVVAVSLDKVSKILKTDILKNGDLNKIRLHIKNSDSGCIGKKINFPGGKQLNGIHIKISHLSGELQRKFGVVPTPTKEILDEATDANDSIENKFEPTPTKEVLDEDTDANDSIDFEPKHTKEDANDSVGSSDSTDPQPKQAQAEVEKTEFKQKKKANADQLQKRKKKENLTNVEPTHNKEDANDSVGSSDSTDPQPKQAQAEVEKAEFKQKKKANVDLQRKRKRENLKVEPTHTEDANDPTEANASMENNENADKPQRKKMKGNLSNGGNKDNNDYIEKKVSKAVLALKDDLSDAFRPLKQSRNGR